jgi:hypothetical protein
LRIVLNKEAVLFLIDRQPELAAELEAGFKEAVTQFIADRKNLITSAMGTEFSKFFGTTYEHSGFQLNSKAKDAIARIAGHDIEVYLAKNDQISLLINRIIDDKIKLAIERGVEAKLVEIAKGIVRGKEETG